MNTALWQGRLVAKCERGASVARQMSRGFWFAATMQAMVTSLLPSCDDDVAATFVE
jgi:hypothetical protein